MGQWDAVMEVPVSWTGDISAPRCHPLSPCEHCWLVKGSNHLGFSSRSVLEAQNYSQKGTLQRLKGSLSFSEVGWITLPREVLNSSSGSRFHSDCGRSCPRVWPFFLSEEFLLTPKQKSPCCNMCLLPQVFFTIYLQDKCDTSFF